MTLSGFVVWTDLVAIIALLGATAFVGIAYSRRVGVWVLVTTGVMVAGFIGAAFYLDGVMRR